MSVYNNLFLKNNNSGNQIDPGALFGFGPVISVEIAIPTPLAEVLTKTNKPLPQPKAGLALIDTGATRSCVDDDVIRSLGVNPVGAAKIHNSNGEQEVNMFPAHFRFPSIKDFEIDFTSAIGVNINAQRIGNQPIIALIGRDILSRCVFIYNGPLGLYTLTL